jgi:excisionase family DNA binding protein
MDQIPTSPIARDRIPRSPFERELARIDPAMYKPIPPALQPIMPLLKAIYQRTTPKEPGKATATPAINTPYLDFGEACAYLRLTERQLRDLCRDQRITHARIDYRTYRFRRVNLDEWFDAYKFKRKGVYD